MDVRISFTFIPLRLCLLRHGRVDPRTLDRIAVQNSLPVRRSIPSHPTYVSGIQGDAEIDAITDQN